MQVALKARRCPLRSLASRPITTRHCAARVSSGMRTRVAANVIPSVRQVQRRLYGHDAQHHHDEHHVDWDKLYNEHQRKVMRPWPVQVEKTKREREQTIKDMEGWIFNNKVTYIDPEQPTYNASYTPGDTTSRQRLFGKIVRIFLRGNEITFNNFLTLTCK